MTPAPVKPQSHETWEEITQLSPIHPRTMRINNNKLLLFYSIKFYVVCYTAIAMVATTKGLQFQS